MATAENDNGRIIKNTCDYVKNCVATFDQIAAIEVDDEITKEIIKNSWIQYYNFAKVCDEAIEVALEGTMISQRVQNMFVEIKKDPTMLAGQDIADYVIDLVENTKEQRERLDNFKERCKEISKCLTTDVNDLQNRSEEIDRDLANLKEKCSELRRQQTWNTAVASVLIALSAAQLALTGISVVAIAKLALTSGARNSLVTGALAMVGIGTFGAKLGDDLAGNRFETVRKDEAAQKKVQTNTSSLEELVKLIGILKGALIKLSEGLTDLSHFWKITETFLKGVVDNYVSMERRGKPNQFNISSSITQWKVIVENFQNFSQTIHEIVDKREVSTPKNLLLGA